MPLIELIDTPEKVLKEIAICNQMLQEKAELNGFIYDQNDLKNYLRACLNKPSDPFIPDLIGAITGFCVFGYILYTNTSFILIRFASALLGTFIIAALVRVIVGGLIDISNTNERMQKAVEINAEISECDKRIDEAQKKMKTIDNKQIFIPNAYINTVCLNYMKQLVDDGRVHNLAETLDRMDEQMHRWNLEKSANDAALQAKRACESAYRAERNAAYANATAEEANKRANKASREANSAKWNSMFK